MSEYKKAAPRRALRTIFMLGALLLSLFLLGSCVGLPGGLPGGQTGVQSGGPSGNQTTPPDPGQSEKKSLDAAQQAYNEGNLQLAESLASALVAPGSAEPADRIGASVQSAAWRIIALTSLADGRPQYTLSALEKWRMPDPQAAAGDEWLQIWRRALEKLPYHEAVKVAETAAASENSPRQLVMEARLYILENRLHTGVLNGLPEELERLYQGTNDPAERRNLEQRLFSRLHGSSQAVMQSLTALVNEKNEKYYPYALFRLEEARRLFFDPTTQDLAREMVGFMAEGSRLADKNLLQTWMEPDLSPLAEFADQGRAGRAGRAGEMHLALVLPMSGQYGNLSDKIIRGAKIACNGFRRNGREISLHLIDSDQPDWLRELSALPPEVQIVGGPLRASDYAAIKSASGIVYGETGQTTGGPVDEFLNRVTDGADNKDLLGARKFFTFLRALEPGEEGRLAWRFFSSSEDQIEAVLRFAKNLGINKYAAMTSGDDYGRRMSALFQSEVAALDGVFVKEQTYPANGHQTWNKLVAGFLGTSKEAKNAPHTPFRALFLPDSWQNATIMMPHFLYYRENRLLFMGTMLWEQGISLQQRADIGSHRLVIFPGAWDPDTLSPSGLILRAALASSGSQTPDFWFSLGYDFVTLAASLPDSAHAAQSTANDLNLALASLPNLPWSGAPFSWDSAGLAKQRLFVLTPTDNGFILADPVKFRVYYQRAWRE